MSLPKMRGHRVQFDSVWPSVKSEQVGTMAGVGSSAISRLRCLGLAPG